MTLPLFVGIALARGIGAVARFAVDSVVSARTRGEFPFGTFAVNISGAFVLGVLAGAAFGADGYRVAGVGFVGAYTTFSTWVFESHRLGEDGQLQLAWVNL